MTTNHRPRPFICRVAAGHSGSTLSGVWRIWAAKNQPDLYVAIRSLGGHVKATVHCPRVGMPTWKRHFGHVTGANRHKVSWTGAKLDDHCTLEWKIFVQGTALGKVPRPVSSDVTLVRPPAEGECLVVGVIIGPLMETVGYPREQSLETHLAAEGRLSDGRRVWVTYCYGSHDVVTSSRQIKFNAHLPLEEIRAAVAEGHVRAFAVGNNSDGSLGFFDARVERRQ